jgi:Na+-transporting methylmalonyl-CoA/oxaloacetate decarboxylase gamma subunit
MKNKNISNEEKRSLGIFLGGIGLLLLGMSAVLYSISFCINSTITTRRFMNTSWVETSNNDEKALSVNTNYDREAGIREVIDFLSDASTNSSAWQNEQNQNEEPNRTAGD